MGKKMTVGEDLKRLEGKVLKGYGAYSKGEKVRWPLPHESKGSVLIRAVYVEKKNGKTYGSKNVEEDDEVPEGTVWYHVRDFGHPMRNVSTEPTWIDFNRENDK